MIKTNCVKDNYEACSLDGLIKAFIDEAEKLIQDEHINEPSDEPLDVSLRTKSISEKMYKFEKNSKYVLIWMREVSSFLYSESTYDHGIQELKRVVNANKNN